MTDEWFAFFVVAQIVTFLSGAVFGWCRAWNEQMDEKDRNNG